MNIKISLIIVCLVLSSCNQAVPKACKQCDDMNLYDVDESKKTLIQDNIVIED
jgi:hypothetical protein